VLAPKSRIRAIVVFGHGWKTAPPSAGYPWVGQFAPWLEHLLGGGNAVIFPRYQLGLGDLQDPARVEAFLVGTRTGFARLGRPRVPVVAVGYSFGASLAFAYAATYRAWNLPPPRAVMAVFPAGLVAGFRLPPLDRSIRVLIQVGDADVIAGRGGADAYWSWLAGHPASRKQYETVRSGAGFAATHAAPKLATLAARRAFWAPLDRLIAAARQR
jgi:dienelactone hydrolase